MEQWNMKPNLKLFYSQKVSTLGERSAADTPRKTTKLKTFHTQKTKVQSFTPVHTGSVVKSK